MAHKSLNDWVELINHATVYDVAITTNLDIARSLSAKFNNDIRLKREDLQPVFSFKLRGAYNRMSQLSASEKTKGVICASAGNHAQGVAFSGRYLGVHTQIVMPVTTPSIKVEAVKRLGGEAILHGDSFDVANKFALEKSKTEGLTYIPPYDDALVIAGQGTISKELLAQWEKIDYVFVAVGGGGLIAGIAAYLGQVAPHVQVIAVESAESACLKAALAADERVVLPEVGIFADGVAVAQIGALPFDIVRMQKSDHTGSVVNPVVITCSTDEICAAIKDVFEETRSIVEPAGALAVAGMKKFINENKLSHQNIVAVVSGANMNFDRLRYIAERTELGEQAEAVFAVNIPEKAGAFLDFCRTLQGRNITEFNYRFNPQFNGKQNIEATVFVGIQLKRGFSERQEIMQLVSSKGYIIADLSDDEIAKLHVRHLIGGHAHLEDEKLYRFEFPERPGALLRFLEKLGQGFNISLFHYRNHAAAAGLVLVGLQTAGRSEEAILDVLRAIDYPFKDVTHNIAYERFLK